MTIYTHPANAEAIRRQAMSGKFDLQSMPWEGITIRCNDMLPKDQPTGRYWLPNGTLVDRENVRVHDRFIEYGPEDVGYLMSAGIIREEREAHFYVVNESLFRFRMFDAPLTTMPFRNITVSGAV